MTTPPFHDPDGSLALKWDLFGLMGYEPNIYQAPIHACRAQQIIVGGGEQAGKSYLTAHEVVSSLPACRLIWLVGDTYDSVSAEYDYIVELLERIGAMVNYSSSKNYQQQMIITALGDKRIITKSGRDVAKLGKERPDLICMCEAGQQAYEVYRRCRGRIAASKGRLFMSGTFETSVGWYAELFRAWRNGDEAEDARSFALPSWTNKVIYPGGRHDKDIMRLEASTNAQRFSERYGGEPGQPVGIVHPEFRVSIHVRDDLCEFDPERPVELWIDPGYAGAYAVEVVQRRQDTIYVIDEVYQQGLINSQIIGICKYRPWWRKVSGGVADVASKGHAAERSVVEAWAAEAGVQLDVSQGRVGVLDGISRVRDFLMPHPVSKEPHLYCHSQCKGLLSEMGAELNPFDNEPHPYVYRSDAMDRAKGELPVDAYNHACKALAYGIVRYYGFSGKRQGKARIRALVT